MRVDDGFEQGMEIPIYYDPMIAKLVTYGKDRTEAIERMLRAIEEYQITGITTTLGFGKFVVQHEAFTSGNFDTHFVKNYFKPGVLQSDNEEEALIAALIMEKLLSEQQTKLVAVKNGTNWTKNRRD